MTMGRGVDGGHARCRPTTQDVVDVDNSMTEATAVILVVILAVAAGDPNGEGLRSQLGLVRSAWPRATRRMG